jgi:hypothetical protein
MPPKENLERACEECIHYWACSRQCGEPMAQSSATGCECYETIKSSMAYYVGTLDGAKGKIPNRLRELAEADEDGRVVVLPCKVGERWTDEEGRAVRITAVIVSIDLFGTSINIYFDYEDATPDDAGSDCVTNWNYFSRHYTCIEAERALQEMEGKKDG